jgi:hypothetical protein
MERDKQQQHYHHRHHQQQQQLWHSSSFSTTKGPFQGHRLPLQGNIV